MSDLTMSLLEEYSPLIRRGEVSACLELALTRLSGIKSSPFHIIREIEISNDPSGVAEYFDDFFRRESSRFEVKAIYSETNGFDINPGRWFFDAFAFKKYGGHEDYDWLSDWQSDGYESMTITGLERLQQVYASPAFKKREFPDAETIASLIVIFKFHRLIQLAAERMQEVTCPILATAHDYDLILEVSPELKK